MDLIDWEIFFEYVNQACPVNTDYLSRRRDFTANIQLFIRYKNLL